ncbi:MAG TPA: prolipoprotein diacylglyceryl transferase [Longimicrobium sp.]|jgi:phosphatidylglycerol:prolipoprotein diacylglycerol transferase|uniref:prolipoprotein diacylglyceryl transferase n=1 Tax=Longimicrobium sp. TaxID=2029185 RepID=UPI002ED948D7
MYPILFTIGGLQITSFGVMIALSFVGAAWMVARALKRAGYDPEHAWDMSGFAALGGILGAKIYYLLLNFPETMANPADAIFSRSGLVWYGGFIGGALAVLFRIRQLKIPVWPYADAVAPGLALGYAIGRVGCFLVGDDYGSPTTAPWAVAFPQGAPPSTAGNLRAFGENVPSSIPDFQVMSVHPTQLYETGITLIILAVLLKLRPRLATQPGMLFLAWLAMAGVERFIVEIFRAKDDRFFGAISMAQMISLGLIALAIALAATLQRRAATVPARA